MVKGDVEVVLYLSHGQRMLTTRRRSFQREQPLPAAGDLELPGSVHDPAAVRAYIESYPFEIAGILGIVRQRTGQQRVSAHAEELGKLGQQRGVRESMPGLPF